LTAVTLKPNHVLLLI